MTDAIEPSRIAVKKAECSQCGGLRNCDIRGHHKVRGVDDYHDWAVNWYILECRGCEHVFVQTVSTSSEDYSYTQNEIGEDEIEYNEILSYWPALSKRKQPDWLLELYAETSTSERLDAAITELYGALDNDLYMLAAIGIRTCFDIASEQLGIDPEQSFQSKLKALVAAGHIGMVDKERLEHLVDAGSASAHRGWRPTANDLNVMMDALEHFINEAFIAPARKRRLDANVKKVKEKVPPRKAAKASKKSDKGVHSS